MAKPRTLTPEQAAHVPGSGGAARTEPIDCPACLAAAYHVSGVAIEHNHPIDRDPLPIRRLRACVDQWPDAETGTYDPRCCRFPKSCSATVYYPEHVRDDQLEPA